MVFTRKRALLATVSVLALTGIASAADMPIKAPPAPAIAQTWAGPYIGLNGGLVWHQLATDTTLNGFGAYDSARTKRTGATFGGQVGYNWQSQNVVYGLEADLGWVDAEGSQQKVANNGVGFPVVHSTKLSWLATVRARAGVTFGPTLVFVTGGLAVGGVDNAWAFPPPFVCPGNPGCVVSDNDTRVGWTAGGGIERFISSNLTVKAEVLYVDLGRQTVTDRTGGYTSRFRNTDVVGRLGLNLKW